MFAVVLGLLALLIGPVLGPVLRDQPRLAAIIDGFVVVTVCGLVILHVLPQSVAFAGPSALVVAALGVLAPVVLHRFDAQVPARAPTGLGTTRQVLTIGVFLAGAFIHAVLDGVALVDDAGHDHGHHHDDESISMLALAVLLHRIPYGLAIWIVGRQRMGTARALAVLGALAAGTVVGAVIFAVASVAVFATVQAFAAGAVLHVLLDAPAFDVAKHPRSSSIGVALGVLVLVVLTQSHPFVAVVNDELRFGSTLLTMAAESAPALLVALLGLGALGAWGHRAALPLWGRGPLPLQALSGVVAGLPAPLCSCTVAPTFERLVRRRVGLAAAVALLVSVPELALPSTVLSFELLGPSLTIARLLGAVVVAVVAGSVVAIASSSSRSSSSVEQAVTGTIDTPPVPFVTATLNAVDHVLPWVLLGLVLAAFCEPLLSTTALAGLPSWAEVPAYALLGAPFYVCASGSTPIVAVLVHKGASAGAVVAFLLAAPATNLATLGIVTRLLSARVAVAFAAAVYVAAVVVGFGVNAAVGAGMLTLPSLHADAGHAHGIVELGALAVLVALLVVSLWRQGARGFLGQILRSLDDAKGGHVHGPHCGHAGFARPGFVKKAAVARVQVDFGASSAPSSPDN